MTPVFHVPLALEAPTFLADGAAAASSRSAALSVSVSFNAGDHLARHPHVHDLIRQGEFSTAEDHWLTFGQREGMVGQYILQPNPDFIDYCMQMDAPEIAAPGLVIVAGYGGPDDPLLGSLLLQSERAFDLLLLAEEGRWVQAGEAAAAQGLADRLLAVVEPGDIEDRVRALAEARPLDRFVFLDPGVQLIPDAVRLVSRASPELMEGAEVVYFDEGIIDEAGRRLSFRKPEWSPVYFLASAYACGFVLFAGEFLTSALAETVEDVPLPFSLMVSALRAEADVRRAAQVVSWSGPDRLAPASEKALAGLKRLVAQMQGELAPHLTLHPPSDRLYLSRPALSRPEPISIVIPTADRKSQVFGVKFNLLDRCIESLSQHDPNTPKEFVIVHNDDMPDARRRELMECGHKLVLFEPTDFNFSAKVNLGAQAASHETLLILNDDVQAIGDWLADCAAWLETPGVAAVGPKLLYPDFTLQHGGCGFFKGIPYHPFHRAPAAGLGVYAGQADTVREMAAVTAACLLTTRTWFERVGGFDEELFDLYNDADFCLRLREAGGAVLYTGRQALLHLESVSLEPSRVHGRQLELFRSKWGTGWELDPYYNLEISRWTPFRWDGTAVAGVPSWAEAGGPPPS